jgi:hypothetical protein
MNHDELFEIILVYLWENQIKVEQDAKKYRIKGFIMDEYNSEEERSNCKI